MPIKFDRSMQNQLSEADIKGLEHKADVQGSEFLLKPHSQGDPRQAVLASCRQHFRPEFLNRLDELVIFNPLRKEDLREVARMMSKELAQRLTQRNVTMHITDNALDFAVAQSYDHMYGARPLRRWLVSLYRIDYSRSPWTFAHLLFT